MNVCSVWFLMACASLTITVHLLRGSALRRILLGGANLAFLAFVVPNKRSAACLALFIVGTYAALWLLRKRPSRFLVVASIVLVVSVFLFLKRYTFLELMLPERAWYSVPVVIGISYMLFRFIHMVIDQWQGQLAPFDFASYASYQLLFFTLVAGPIQRYNDFDHYWRSGDPPNGDEAQTLACWNRLLTGMIKVGLLAPIAWALFEESRTYLLGAAHDQVLLRFALFFYGYPVFLYLNFSGYTDIVVAAARLIGLTLPENFNRPYLARNIIDFWNRWHISLTHWIRDYVFMTLYKLGVESFPRASKLLGYGLLFFALLLAGIWHGSTADFAVFGAIHGLGAATNQIYGDSLRSWLGRERFRAYNRSRLIHWLAILTTIHYVCFAFMFFSSGIGGTFDVLRAVRRSLVSSAGMHSGPSPAGFLLLMLTLLILWATWKREALLAYFDRLGEHLSAKTGSLYALVIIKLVIIAFMLISLWALEKEPEIAYMRF